MNLVSIEKYHFHPYSMCSNFPRRCHIYPTITFDKAYSHIKCFNLVLPRIVNTFLLGYSFFFVPFHSHKNRGYVVTCKLNTHVHIQTQTALLLYSSLLILYFACHKLQTFNLAGRRRRSRAPSADQGASP